MRRRRSPPAVFFRRAFVPPEFELKLRTCYKLAHGPGLIAEIRRNAHYPAAEWRALGTTEPLDPHAIAAQLRAAFNDAEAFVTLMPTDRLGLLFLQGGKVVQPDPGRLDSYQAHAGQRRGQWPASAEITAAMLERYSSPPKS